LARRRGVGDEPGEVDVVVAWSDGCVADQRTRIPAPVLDAGAAGVVEVAAAAAEAARRDRVALADRASVGAARAAPAAAEVVARHLEVRDPRRIRRQPDGDVGADAADQVAHDRPRADERGRRQAAHVDADLAGRRGEEVVAGEEAVAVARRLAGASRAVGVGGAGPARGGAPRAASADVGEADETRMGHVGEDDVAGDDRVAFALANGVIRADQDDRIGDARRPRAVAGEAGARAPRALPLAAGAARAVEIDAARLPAPLAVRAPAAVAGAPGEVVVRHLPAGAGDRDLRPGPAEAPVVGHERVARAQRVAPDAVPGEHLVADHPVLLAPEVDAGGADALGADVVELDRRVEHSAHVRADVDRRSGAEALGLLGHRRVAHADAVPIDAVDPRAGPPQHASLNGSPGADSGAGRDGDPRAGGEQWVELRAHGAGVVRVAEEAVVADREAERAAAMVEEAHAVDHGVTRAAEVDHVDPARARRRARLAAAVGAAHAARAVAPLAVARAPDAAALRALAGRAAV